MGVIGPGRVGLHLAAAAADAGVERVGLRGLDPPSADERRRLPAAVVRDTWDRPCGSLQAGILMLAVPDHAIVPVARRLSETHPLDGRCVLHCSGLHTHELLHPCAERGAATASWHPLQTFPAGPPDLRRWAAVPIAVEGSPPAVEAAFDLARALGAEPWSIRPADKPLYHAAAAVAANLTHILVAEARHMLGRSGMTPDEARDALGNLVSASVRTALDADGLETLTGPIARGDAETVRRHLDVLPPHLADAYRALAALVSERKR